MSRQTAKRKADADQRAKALATKAQKEHKKQVAIADAEALGRINHAKQTRSFLAEWGVSGHGAVVACNDMAAFAMALADKAVGEKAREEISTAPFVIKVTSGALDLDKSNKLKQTLDDWANTFTGYCEKSTVKRSQAELTNAMGSSELESIWKELVLVEKQLTKGQPSMLAQLAKTFLYGYLDTCVSHDFEPNFLGCVRYQVGGYTAYLLIDGASLATGLPELLKVKAPVAVQQMKTWVDSLTAPDADLSREALGKILSAGIKVRHVVLEPGQVLVVPPCTFVTTAVMRQSKVYGLRRHFLPSGPWVSKQFSALLPCCADSPGCAQFLKATLDFMSLGWAEQAVLPSYS